MNLEPVPTKAVAESLMSGYLTAMRWFAKATEHVSVQDALVTLAVRGPISTEN